MRLLAVLVVCCSLAQLLTVLAALTPHVDVPGHPVPQLLVAAAAVAGVVLARALWRRQPGAARGLPAWGLGVALWLVGLVLVVASPEERREALPVLAVALPLWAGVLALLTRAVRGRAPAT